MTWRHCLGLDWNLLGLIDLLVIVGLRARRRRITMHIPSPSIPNSLHMQQTSKTKATVIKQGEIFIANTCSKLECQVRRKRTALGLQGYLPYSASPVSPLIKVEHSGRHLAGLGRMLVNMNLQNTSGIAGICYAFHK